MYLSRALLCVSPCAASRRVLAITASRFQRVGLRQVFGGEGGEPLAVLDDEWHVPISAVPWSMRIVFTTFEASMGEAGFLLRWDNVGHLLCACGGERERVCLCVRVYFCVWGDSTVYFWERCRRTIDTLSPPTQRQAGFNYGRVVMDHDENDIPSFAPNHCARSWMAAYDSFGLHINRWDGMADRRLFVFRGTYVTSDPVYTLPPGSHGLRFALARALCWRLVRRPRQRCPSRSGQT